MKKLTPRYKKWLVYRSRQNSKCTKYVNRRKRSKHRRFIVRVWLGDHDEYVLCLGAPITPPSVVCFDKNTKESIEFLALLRDGIRAKRSRSASKKLLWIQRPRGPGKLGRISTYFDYSAITKISTAASLVAAAEYDRAHLLIGSVPPAVNVLEWRSGVFNKLHELGFFEIVGLSPKIGEHYRQDGEIRTMRFLKGINASDIQLASERLIELSKFIDIEGPMSDDVVIALNSALSEAMANVARHAYPSNFEFKYEHVHAWWVTASADRRTRRLTVVIYDQGASIPVTLPQNRLFTELIQLLGLSSGEPFEYANDAAYIKGALRRGHTQTGERGRGEGLPQMKELVDICRGGSLTIRSRGGMCRYEFGKELITESHRCSIGGTLIEWVIDLPKVA